MKAHPRWLALGVVAVALSMAVQACGSDDSDSGSTSKPSTGTTGASSGGGATFTGEPVKLMMIGIPDNPNYSQPELFEAGQAGVSAINAAGGVNGHELILDTCDGNFDPNQEMECVKKTASGGYSALLGNLQFAEGAELDTLAAANVPAIIQGDNKAANTHPISYPTPVAASWPIGNVIQAKNDGVKTVKIGWVNAPPGVNYLESVKSVAGTAGLDVIGDVSIEFTASEFTGIAATLAEGDPDGIMMLVADLQTVAIIKALKQGGYGGKIYVPVASLAPESAESLGSAGDGVRQSWAETPFTDTEDPLVQEFLADMEQYAPDAALDDSSEQAWSGVYFFNELMKDATSFTGSDVIAALDAANGVTYGLYGPFVGSGTPAFPEFPRLIDPGFYPTVLDGGKAVPDGDYTNLKDALEE
jgi:ABC-type branched-subunit amino acid transport system substrate-binding protein